APRAARRRPAKDAAPATENMPKVQAQASAPARAPVNPTTPRRSERPRADHDDGGDASHLPAFLLRPVKIKAS
ncbi:MAG TPA: DEAD/DEAH box helicase, partial [Ancylobacter sp.]